MVFWQEMAGKMEEHKLWKKVPDVKENVWACTSCGATVCILGNEKATPKMVGFTHCLKCGERAKTGEKIPAPTPDSLDLSYEEILEDLVTTLNLCPYEAVRFYDRFFKVFQAYSENKSGRERYRSVFEFCQFLDTLEGDAFHRSAEFFKKVLETLMEAFPLSSSATTYEDLAYDVRTIRESPTLQLAPFDKNTLKACESILLAMHENEGGEE